MDTSQELLFVNAPGERLDRFLVERFPAISRSTFQRWIGDGLVLVNGEPVKKRYLPEVGDEIEVQFAASPEMDLVPEPMDLVILFEDEDLLVLNKPIGLVVHPGAGHWSGTLVHGLLHHCRQLPGDRVRPGLVHRLDRDTSGVMVVAKTASAQMALTRQFAERSVEKHYLALCWGIPSPTSCCEPIGRDPRHRQRMAVVPDGKEARTCWNILWSGEGTSLLEVRLFTGRTHQIRVHLAWVGCPLVGDPLYGGLRPATRLDSQWLHSESLCFTHPRTGERLRFSAPAPEKLLNCAPAGVRAGLHSRDSSPHREESNIK